MVPVSVEGFGGVVMYVHAHDMHMHMLTCCTVNETKLTRGGDCYNDVYMCGFKRSVAFLTDSASREAVGGEAAPNFKTCSRSVASMSMSRVWSRRPNPNATRAHAEPSHAELEVESPDESLHDEEDTEVQVFDNNIEER